MFHVPEQYRIVEGPLASDRTYGNNGAFAVTGLVPYRQLLSIASDGAGWEHVSVHVSDGKGRQWTPGWDEMSYLKGLFWDDEDVVVEYHPRKSQYVNHHEHTLHLWRPIDQALPEPGHWLVGPLASEVVG